MENSIININLKVLFEEILDKRDNAKKRKLMAEYEYWNKFYNLLMSGIDKNYI